MNNEQFRKLMLANSAKASKEKDASSSQAAGFSGGSSLGSRQRSSIPMTPRAVGSSHVDFAKQMAQRNQQANPTKQFKAAVPRGVKIAAGYTDRSKEREAKTAKTADDRSERLKALEESLKNEEIDKETYERLRFEIAGGDLESTHLVKGLDFKLLERVRRGEDVYSGKKEEEAAIKEEDVDVDDAFDELESEEVKAIEKDKTVKKKGQLSTVAVAPGKKRTRDQILADLKAARAAAKAQAEPMLGDRFRKIGVKQQPGTRIERDSKGREVMIIVDADGHEKRKIRKVQSGGNAADMDNGLLMPDKNAKPLGMEVPEHYRKQVPATEEDEDVDIFDGVGDDYDPLAGMDESDSDSDNQGKDGKTEDESENPTPDRSMPPPPPRPKAPNNYFKGSKTSLLSEQDTKAPSMSDPAMMAAIKRAAALRPRGDDDDNDEASDDEAAQKAKADEARRKKLLRNDNRDAEDLDMGFGTSRYEDEEDFDDHDIKLSAWGDDGDEGGGGGGGGGGKKRKRNKKRKGDVNNAADVLRVMEQRKS
ncbi:hypothetical protein MY3296_003866 [Beauveria thailandica]